MRVTWGPSVFSYPLGDPDGPKAEGNSAGKVPRAIVVDPLFDWANDGALPGLERDHDLRDARGGVHRPQARHSARAVGPGADVAQPKAARSTLQAPARSLLLRSAAPPPGG